MILKLNVAGNVNSAFNNYLNEEVLLNRECPVCLSKQNASLEKRVVVAGKYVIIHLKRYLLNDGGWVKDMSLVNCVSEQLSFSVDLDDEVQCRKSYHLVASICHSGTLAAGHYTAHILHKQDSQWLLCNDKAVLPIQSSEIDNKHSYVLFYELSYLFNCCFFFLSFYAEQGGLIIFFSSGLTTLLITPVTQVRFTYKSLQILLEETKQGGEITISSSGMTTPLITSVNPSANIEFGWVLW